ncbi:MAG: RagB/SusD family nutrient uptake outer membrane protein [Cyclobacteriaceae bacterium]
MKVQKYITAVFLILVVFSCSDYLEEVPKSFASPENYYDADGAEAAVIGAYGMLQPTGVYGYLQYFLVTDIIRTATFNTLGGIGTFTHSAENSEVILPIWQDHYQAINAANAAITNIPGIDMDEERKNTLLAEAKFLKALLYFNLIRYFGDVPYKTVEVASLDALKDERDPVAFINERIIEDLEFGIEHLGLKGDVAVGRATVDAAKTLLAYVYLTRGSMAQRDGLGDGKADFQLAAQYAKEVINAGRFQLVDYYPDVFIPENKNNMEIIFDVQYLSGGFNEGNYIGMHLGLMGPPELGGSYGSLNATDYYHYLFESTDMVRQQWNTPWVRVIRADSLADFTELWPQRWRRIKMGKWRRYPVRSAGYNFTDWDINWPVFRYADVLLIYAEALNELNNGPDAEVFDALNQLRSRARNVDGDGTRVAINANKLPRNTTYQANILPDISAAEYPDYDSMREYIHFERARELGGEGKRWFDLVRWGELVSQINAVDNFINPYTGDPEKGDWSLTAGNVREFHRLLPIPSQEFQVNTLMTQNPGF